MTAFQSIQKALHALKQGKCIILMDDEQRENEGDLVCAGEKITPELINFMATEARGLICLALSSERVEQLRLPPMTWDNRAALGTGFTISIEAAEGVSTGISAVDRAHTIRLASQAQVNPEDFISPGHVFPIRAKPKGVLERTGQTEGSIDLMKLSGLQPAAVICEIMNRDGSMARRSQLQKFSKKHRIPLVTIHELIQYRLQQEIWVKETAIAKLPTIDGPFHIKVFEDLLSGQHHLALIAPSRRKNTVPLVRIHSECLTGDALGSLRCDCGWQLKQARKKISEVGGVLLYLRQEGRGIGLNNKIKAYGLQDQGLDTVEANHQLGLATDAREYYMATHILRLLKIRQIHLLTNNPQKISALEQGGIHICQRVSLWMKPTAENHHYLHTKQKKMGHFEDSHETVSQ